MNERRGPSPVLAAALLLVVALVGVLGGIVLDRTVLRHDGPPGWPGRPGPHGPSDHEIRGRVLERITASLADELELTPGQREEISAVLERHEARLAEAMAVSRPRLQEILEETHREMLAILTPEQRERFERTWMARHGRHRALWHGPADSARGPDMDRGID